MISRKAILAKLTKEDLVQLSRRVHQLAYSLLHLIRRFYVQSEKARRPIEWIIMRLVKVGARIVYHARYWHVHIASAFALRHHYRAVLG